MQQLLSERIRNQSPFAYVLLIFFYVTASKISLIQVQGCEKRNLTQIQKPGPKIRSENSDFRNLDRQQVLSRCRGLNFNRYSYLVGVKKVSRGQKLSRSIDKLSRSYRDCDKNQLKSSTDSQLSRRCRATVKLSVRRCRAICLALMNSFFSLVSRSNLHGFNTRLEQHVS